MMRSVQAHGTGMQKAEFESRPTSSPGVLLNSAFCLLPSAVAGAPRGASLPCTRAHPYSSLPIFVEASPRLSSQPSRVHHLHEQRTRPVFGIAEALLQHAQDGETNVEADEVGERERTHRMIHAELHHAVDRLTRGDAFVQREDRL